MPQPGSSAWGNDPRAHSKPSAGDVVGSSTERVGEGPLDTEKGLGGKPAIKLAPPYPLLDPGDYFAICTEADYAWAGKWGKWKVRLVLEPQNYQGRAYTGRLCKFLGLGDNRKAPYAGPRSHFRMLWVEVNGEQPTGPECIDLSTFVGREYRITVETVTETVKNGKREPLAPAHWYSIVREIHPVATLNPLTN
jgi:hypothetical protein